MFSGITSGNLWLQCKGYFVGSLARNRQWKCPSISGVSCSMSLVVFVKRKTSVNYQWLKLSLTGFCSQFKNVNKASCPNVKCSTIDSAQNYATGLKMSVVATCTIPRQRRFLDIVLWCSVRNWRQLSGISLSKLFSVTKPFPNCLSVLTEITLEFRKPKILVHWLKIPARHNPRFNIFCSVPQTVQTCVFLPNALWPV